MRAGDLKLARGVEEALVPREHLIPDVKSSSAEARAPIGPDGCYATLCDRRITPRYCWYSYPDNYPEYMRCPACVERDKVSG